MAAVVLFTLVELGTTQINPYPLIGSQHSAGLGSVIGDAPANLAELVDAVYDYVQPLYYPSPSPETQNEIRAVIYKALNGYENQLIRPFSGASVYNAQQQFFIDLMLGGLLQSSVESVYTFLADVEDNITKSGLSKREQAPLLLATLTGRSDYLYWLDKIETPGGWVSYFDANEDINYADIPYWVAASMEGALLAAVRNDIEQPTENVSIDPAHALATGIATVAVKVMYKLMPRIQPGLINRLLDMVDEMENPERTPDTGAAPPDKPGCGCKS